MTHSFDSGREAREHPRNTFVRYDASDYLMADVSMRNQNISRTFSGDAGTRQLEQSGILPQLTIFGMENLRPEAQIRDSQGRSLGFTGDYFANGRQNAQARAEHRGSGERAGAGEGGGGRQRRRAARRSARRWRRRSGGGRRSSARSAGGGGAQQRSGAVARTGGSRVNPGNANIENAIQSPENESVEEENNDEILEA